jgi:hypothetical protein
MSQTLHFGVFEADSLFLINSLDLTKTLFELKFNLVYLFYFELFLVPLVVKLTFLTLSLLSCRRFIKDFPLLALVELILQSKSSC